MKGRKSKGQKKKKPKKIGRKVKRQIDQMTESNVWPKIIGPNIMLGRKQKCRKGPKYWAFARASIALAYSTTNCTIHSIFDSAFH